MLLLLLLLLLPLLLLLLLLPGGTRPQRSRPSTGRTALVRPAPCM
jgi:hypothetical protein